MANKFLQSYRKIVLAIIAFLVIVVFVGGALIQAIKVNTDFNSVDQLAYMKYAKNLAETNFQFVGGRNRMPLYPSIMALMYKKGISEYDFFLRGKIFGILIGITGSIVTFLILRSISESLETITGTLVAMFTVFVYKSPYFQADVLFYIIGLVLFFLIIRLIKTPDFFTAISAGIVAGVGYLTKASVLPGVLLAAVLLLFRGFFVFWKRYRSQKEDCKGEESFVLLRNIFYVLLFLGCYLAVIYPYIKTSKERFGRYFYNVNSTFYMWYDSWGEVKKGTRAHGDRQGWPDMPEKEIPSFQRYISENTPKKIIARLGNGYIMIIKFVFQSYGYAKFILFYAFNLTLLIYQNLDKFLKHFFKSYNWLILTFVMGYFIGYTTLYAWYTPIAYGNRFVLSLFLPAVFLFVWIITFARKNNLNFNFLGREISASYISPAVLLFLISYLIADYPFDIQRIFGGR